MRVRVLWTADGTEEAADNLQHAQRLIEQRYPEAFYADRSTYDKAAWQSRAHSCIGAWSSPKAHAGNEMVVAKILQWL